MMLCHQFYMRQSHAKNDWQTIATVCMFLACKVEETPRLLRDVVVVAYERTYKWDPSAPQRIRQREVYDKQKQLILTGERLLLATVAFDLNIQHPYKPLVAAVKRLGISHNDLVKVAWNFVNDWLCTTLCLQYKPHYIAAGSLFLAAKFHKVKLPAEKGKVWWLEFDVSPKQLEEVIQQMLKFLEKNRKLPLPGHARVTESAAMVKKAMSNSPQSCILNGSIISQDYGVALRTGSPGKSTMSKCSLNMIRGHNHTTVKEVLECQTSDSSTSSVVEDGEGGLQLRIKSDQSSAYNVVNVLGRYSEPDVNWASLESSKVRRCERAAGKNLAEAVDDENGDAWIERELENRIELGSAYAKKKRRVL
ncbi:cyclin-T1-3 isoform X2 [Malania oleifera]|nr:cyclin-T1-3 isoform X2 [Malania oleifera]XP_057974820.1 cyclin-T1-3 isoform X2 [Malania oleifera]